MLENPTSGQGGALSNITRRSFAAWFGAATALAGTTATAAIEPKVERPSAALLDLAREVDAAEAAYRVAAERVDVAWETWSPLWPVPPASIRIRYSWDSAQAERGLDGLPILRDGCTTPWGLRSDRNLADLAASHADHIARREAKLRKKASAYQLKWVRYSQKELAEFEAARVDRAGYDAECDRIRCASGFEGLQVDQSQAAIRLVQAVRRTLEFESATAAAVKARAAAALGTLREKDQVFIAVYDQKPGAVPLVVLLAHALAGGSEGAK